MAEIDVTYKKLIDNIGSTLQRTRENAVRAVNKELVTANWEIGKHIVEFEQNGKEKAEYGSSLLTNLSKDLKTAYGKGFGKSNIYLCRQFYLKFPIFQTLSGKLSWSHYAELLTISDDKSRAFYEKQCEIESWSFRELKRQIDSSLFERLALSKDKDAVLTLSEKGQIITQPKDIIKDPYIFEFLGLPEQSIVKERKLESKLIDNSYLNLAKDFRLLQDNSKSQLITNIFILTWYSIIAF